MARKTRLHLYMALAYSTAIPAAAFAAPAPGPDEQSSSQQSQAGNTQQSDLVARGKYLVIAGDCVGCHSRAGKPAFSGGDYMDTPFGGIAPPNIIVPRHNGDTRSPLRPNVR